MDNLRAALLMVAAMLGFAIEDMGIKLLAGALPLGQIILLLGIAGCVIFGTILRTQKRAMLPSALGSWPIILRCVGEVVGTFGFTSAITLTPLSSASAILQATPLVVTLGAALFLQESVGWRRWSASIVGFLGVLLIVRPGLDGFDWLSLFAIQGVIGLAIRDLATRRVPPTTSSMQLSFLAFAMLVPTSILLLAAFGDQLQPMTARQSLYIIATVAIAALAYYAIVAAMRLGDVSFVAPFRYVRLVFAMIIGVAVFDEAPDILTLTGSAIIVVSGIYTVVRERKTAATI
ncbi:MAG: DMT family transporter [Sulfitobacter sp.]